MSVALTSKESYSQHLSSGNKLRQRQVILNHMNMMIAFGHDGATRRQVADVTGIELGAAAGRVNKLIKDGLLVIRVRLNARQQDVWSAWWDCQRSRGN